MRKTLGWILFFVGLIVLAWWSKGHNAKDIEAHIRQEADDLTNTLNETTPSAEIMDTVSGRDITLDGVIPKADEENIIDQYEALEGMRVVRSNLETIPTVSPYTMEVKKSENGEIHAKGYADSKKTIADFNAIFEDGDADLSLAAGAPENWSTLVTTGTNALQKLDYGTLTISDQELSLDGFVSASDMRNEAEAEIDALPSTIKRNLVIDSPVIGPDFTAMFDITNGLDLSGTSTENGDEVRIAELLSAPVHESSLRSDNEGSIEGIEARLEHLGDFLDRFDTAVITATEDQITFKGELTSNAMNEGDMKAFMQGFNEGDMIETIIIEPAADAKRTNILSGQNEYYSPAGYWLPDVDFEVSLLNCKQNTLAMMEGQSIQFVPGSAQLDQSNRALINRLAGLLQACLRDGGFVLQIGGHTDADGDDNANLILSQKRAEAVRAAIEARGVDVSNVTATGFGETQPIASNFTSEGKAQNRRTTFEWTAQN